MMNRYLKKNAVFLCKMFLFSLLLVWGNKSAYTQTITQNDNITDVYVHSGDKGKYLLLEFRYSDLYLPLSTDLSAWSKIEDWKKRRDQAVKLFSLDDFERAKTFQEDIGFAGQQVDGKWGTGSWQQMAKSIKGAIDNNIAKIDIAGFIFELDLSELELPVKLPAYDETDTFFKNLQQWQEKCIAIIKLNKAELPSEIVIYYYESSRYLIWASNLEKDFKITYDPPKQYFKNVKIENDEIFIERIYDVYPGEVTFPLKIQHKNFHDIEKSLTVKVFFYPKPIWKIISDFLFQWAHFFTFVVFLILVFLLINYIKDRLGVAKCYEELKRFNLSNKDEIIKNIDKLYETADFYRGLRDHGKNIVDEISGKILKFESYLDKDQTRKPGNAYIVDVLNKLSAINKYVEKNNKIDDHFKTFVMKVKNLLYSTGELASLTDDFESDDKIKIMDNIYDKIERSKKEQEEKFKRFVANTKKIFQPLADNQDFINFTNDEKWSKLNSDGKRGCIQNLTENIRALEIRFPIRLKFIEDQLKRAAWITEKILKANVRAQFLTEYKLAEDIERLDSLLKKEYLWENKENKTRPEWADQLPFNQEEKNLRDEFWHRVWDHERLGFSIQYIQRIIFKLRLVLKGHSSIEENRTFKHANELLMAAEAVLFILQGIVLSCGKLYHVIAPGQKVSNDFVSPEIDHHILRDRVYHDIYKKHSWHHRDICDVVYWGLNEITANGVKKIKDSKVVIHYEKE